MRVRDAKHEYPQLSTLLYWERLGAPGVVHQKDGSLLAVLQVRGPDLASAVDEELVALSARLNTLLKSFGSGWTFFSDTQRQPVADYPEGHWPDPISAAVDAERRVQFLQPGGHYTTTTYLSCVYTPPRGVGRGWRHWLYANLPAADPGGHVEATFCETIARTLTVLQTLYPRAVWLTAAETRPGYSPLLTYLHSTVSPWVHDVGLPEETTSLDTTLTDTDVAAGLYPTWGAPENPLTFGGYIGCLSVRQYPPETYPGLLDRLHELALPFRAVVRYIALDTDQAVRALYAYRKKWMGSTKRASAVLAERLHKDESAMVEHVAIDYAQEAADAQAAAQHGSVSFGYCTNTIVLWHPDFPTFTQQVRAVTSTLQGLGCVTKVEDLNAFAAWRGTIPGDVYSNVRRPLLQSMNLAHLLTATTPWDGPAWDAHLDGPPLCVVTGRGRTPVRISLHDGDVGHTGIIGRTGAGKSTLINFLCLQWQRYPGAQTVIFDKGGASRALTYAVGGQWYDLGLTPLQPLARLDAPGEMAWAVDWLDGLCALERTMLTAAQKEALYKGLDTMATLAPSQRTMSTLVEVVSDLVVKQTLRAYTATGPYGALVDAQTDALADTPWLCFEMETLLETPRALNAVLPALFHRLEQRLTGVPVRYFLHEGWLAFDTPYWATRMRGWLKGFRVKNGSVVVATQSLADAVDSAIMPALLDNVATWIYTANALATGEEVGKYYTALGLNDRERQRLALATPKQDYYLRTRAGTSMFQLELGPLALKACRTPGPAEVRHLAALYAANPATFATTYLKEVL